MVQQYDYESLGADAFQQLCQALLTRTHRDIQCFPVGMPDGGRDASVPIGEKPDGIVYQVKYRKPTPNKLTTPDDIYNWLTGHIQGEIHKIEGLRTKGATRYVVMTNAQCSSHEEIGTRDRVQAWMSKNIPIPSQVWWRDDIDRRLDSETEIKRSYGLLRDTTGLAEMLGVTSPGAEEHEILRVARTDRRVSSLLRYLRHQYKRDRVVKFKQTELEPDLLDVFVDVPASGQSRDFLYASSHLDPRVGLEGEVAESSAMEMWKGLLTNQTQSMIAGRRRGTGVPAGLLLLSDTLASEEDGDGHARLVLEGAPGQGKSTIAQYVCQVHRARLLGLSDEIKKFDTAHVASPIRLPFHVDLRDLSSWLRREDPFDVRNEGEPTDWHGSLEAFLAAQVRYESGGMSFTVSDLDAVTSATPILIMLDGLDEVPDLNDRKNVVTAVNDAVNRIVHSCPSLVTVVTSRPSAFAKTPGFSPEEYEYLSLEDLSLPLVLTYSDGWLRARKVPHQEAYNIRKVLGEKLGHPHIVDLARNPMQLAILLWLVKRLGTSLPDKRTALYTEYLSTFLDREAEKSTIVRDERDLILELHGYVAWELHCQAELGHSRGRIADTKLKSLLRRYLHREGYKKPNLVDQLFTGITQRVMVLTSRVQNTFEFEVQPLREYFAARYLYLTARASPPGRERRGSRPDRFEALLRNPYWWNVTRFYAGFSDKGELASLAELLESLCEEGDFSLVAYPRQVSSTLLRDQVFTQAPRSAGRIFERVTSEASLSLLLSVNRRDAEGITFGEDGGDIVDVMQKRIEKSIRAGSMDFNSCRVLARNADVAECAEWWFQKYLTAKTDHQKRQWLAMSGPLQALHFLNSSKLEKIAEAPTEISSVFWRTAIEDGISYWPSQDSVAYQGMRNCLQEVIFEQHTVRLRRDPFSLLTYALAPSSLYRLARFRSVARPTQQLMKIAMTERRDRDQALDRLISTTLSLYQQIKSRSDIGAWESAHEDLVDVLGSESRKTQLFALMGGELRCGPVSKEKGGRLLDPGLSAVYRARYARQRRNDHAWWAEQIVDISSVRDAWLVVLALLLWAPSQVIRENAKPIDSWVRNFTVEDIAPLVEFFNHPGLSRVVSSEEKLPLPRGLSHQLQMILALSRSGVDFLDVANSAMRKSRGDREFVALYAKFKIQIISWRGMRAIVKDLDEIREAFRLMARGSSSTEFSMYSVHGLREEEARAILHDAVAMVPSALSVADASLTSHLTANATPLAAVAKAEGWFERDDYL
ncbi:NACHT domain-containing protein [Streptomyces bacillaris]|uniref:NACHT domain-containing protein n=1 Tax=Streptomyces bacillaris TaxID=68179 RepID=UPI0034614B25